MASIVMPEPGLYHPWEKLGHLPFIASTLQLPPLPSMNISRGGAAPAYKVGTIQGQWDMMASMLFIFIPLIAVYSRIGGVGPFELGIRLDVAPIVES